MKFLEKIKSWVFSCRLHGWWFFLDMNKCELKGAHELLSMLTDDELMSVKDTVTKSMIPTDSVSV